MLDDLKMTKEELDEFLKELPEILKELEKYASTIANDIY